MTREEAIKILKSKMDGSVDTSYEWAETVRMAIEALSNADKHVERVDLISRQDAIDALKKQLKETSDLENEIGWKGVSPTAPIMKLMTAISTLPSAEPKTGHWVEIEDYNGDIHYQCDQCGEEFILIDGTPEDNNYWHCPNCGSYNGEVRKND